MKLVVSPVRFMNSKVTYRQQYTRCGKERCRKCKEGSGHGPYWYAYWSENGRTISKYIGLRLPAHIEAERQVAGHAADSDATPRIAKDSTTPDKVAATSANLVSGYPQEVPLQLNTQVLRIYALGQLRVDRLYDKKWRTVVNRTWHRHRARALLGCLLSAPGRRLGR